VNAEIQMMNNLSYMFILMPWLLMLIAENFMTGCRVVFDREKFMLGWKKSDCKWLFSCHSYHSPIYCWVWYILWALDRLLRIIIMPSQQDNTQIRCLPQSLWGLAITLSLIQVKSPNTNHNIQVHHSRRFIAATLHCWLPLDF